MIRGIGVDTAKISRIERLLGAGEGETAFLRRVFTEAERLAAPEGALRAEYFAVRFAAKEAVFKAVAHLLPERTFDLRLVETLSRDDGCPYVNTENEALRPILLRAGVERVHVSATTEDGCATVFVVAE